MTDLCDGNPQLFADGEAGAPARSKLSYLLREWNPIEKEKLQKNITPGEK